MGFAGAVSAGGSLFVIAVSSIYLLQGKHIPLARRSIAVAASFGLASALSVVVLGDESGYLSTEHQKMKLAAIEAMWKTEPAPAAFTLFGFPDQRARETHYAIHIPWAMGLIGTRSLNTEIPGIQELVKRGEEHIRRGIVAFDALQKIRAAGSLAAVPEDVRKAFEDNGRELGYALLLKRYLDDPRQATPEQITRASWDLVPHVPTLFWSFRIMVGLGFFFILLTATFFYLSARRQLDRYPLLLRVAVLTIPAPTRHRRLPSRVRQARRRGWAGEGRSAGRGRGARVDEVQAARPRRRRALRPPTPRVPPPPQRDARR